MTLTLTGLGIISIVELLSWAPPLWRLRKALMPLLILVQSVFTGLLFGQDMTLWTGMILVLGVYRLVNLLRVVEARMRPEHLWRVTRLTSRWLMACQLLVLAAVNISDHYWLNAPGTWVRALLIAQLAIAGILWTSTSRNLRAARPPVQIKSLSDKQLPTLSVAIPARNETDDLEECLQSLLSSDYPKLEILVLDDCSQNKRTPGIIRDFAQSGVVFVAGQTPPENWLAKNFAYEQLAKEASGDLLLFCGVDTRFRPGSLRAMVEIMLQKKKRMVGFIPRNRIPGWRDGQSLLVQPFRYAWELALPRKLIKRPPVLSTCWLITTKALRDAGGFEAVSRSISPESYFARSCAKQKEGYAFLRAGGGVGLTSIKSLAEQRATAVRTRYPQLHRRPELVSLLSLGELIGLVSPFVVLAAGLLRRDWTLFAVSLLTSALLIDFYCRIVSMTYGKFLWRGLWTLPLAALYDVCLLKYSMWQYEFREVIWKGRNVCVPVMRAIPGSGKRP